MQTEIVKISSSLYSVYYQLVQQTAWGNPMLPDVYDDSLWGDIVLQDDKVVGGWVGTLRGNGHLTKYIAKSVYFDAYPIFQTQELEQSYLTQLIEAVKQHAKNEHIVMLNLTHWVRGKQMPLMVSKQTEATFLIDVSLSEEQLWKQLEGSLRNKIRKAEKNGVIVDALKGENALHYLPDFQNLRKTTQVRSVKHNGKTSMLLKSDEFFTKKMMQHNATLFIAKMNEVVVSASLIMQGGKTAYFYMSGSDLVADRTTGCSAYLKWKAITYFCNSDEIQFVDMGGVPFHPDELHPAYGAYRFKKSFGGEYQEFDGGQIAISPMRYKILHWLLGQRRLLRMFSNKL